MGSSTELDKSADQALFDGDLNGLVALVFENERPMSGLSGLLDWRFHGTISKALRAGAFRGTPGECIYFPVIRFDRTYHLILAGAGQSRVPGARGSLPPETLSVLKKNLASLRVSKIGLSRAELGKVAIEALSTEGLSSWIVP